MRRRATTMAGFTLIELMISLVISSLLVIMLLAIFSRMSFAFREHQQIITIQQVLSAGRNALEADARQAGLAMSQGFTISSDLDDDHHSPLRVVNSASGPDEVGFYYADPGVQALVVAGPPVPSAVEVVVDDATGFHVGDLVVLSTADTTSVQNPLGETDANLAQFTACVVQISALAGDELTFATAGDWGNLGNVHCAAPSAGKTMVYKFVAHYWRIDPARPELGALQLDATGALTGTPAFVDQAYGITDLQAATYFFDNDGLDTDDPDTDPRRDWESSDEQTVLTAPRPVASPFAPPLMMTLSLVARTTANVEGVTTARTPRLVDATNVDHNPLGDRASVVLPSATDPRLAGNRIYRYLTFQTDLRNLGVGR
ncbi:MAG: prepilin-type N-terminal cleavage/methylation domain-containing protein [Myxococcales bacterium]|nr:prepilin-type N-terminal cleavage/methylation domain-containing protein [Myxococcales bacterium]